MERIVDMISPITGGKVKEVISEEHHTFRGDEYVVPAHYYVCLDSGEEFTTNEQDQEYFASLYGQYRKRHNIPYPDEIKAIREKYGLSLTQITKILGFGKNQWAQYEEGQLPSLSNGRLISLIADPKVMRKCVELAVLSDEEKNKILWKIK